MTDGSERLGAVHTEILQLVRIANATRDCLPSFVTGIQNRQHRRVTLARVPFRQALDLIEQERGLFFLDEPENRRLSRGRATPRPGNYQLENFQ